MVLLDDFTSIVQRSGAHLVETRYYGVWDGYPFSARLDRPREPGTASFRFRLPATLEGRLFKTLRKSFPKGCVLTAAGGSTYCLTCNGGPLRHCDEPLHTLLNQLTRSLRDAGVLPTDVCPLCGRSSCDAYADVQGYTAVHRACVEAMAENTVARAERAVRSGSYITGLIGALVGGLVASIPTIVAYFLGYLVGYLYALIPLGAYYGYKLFRGKMNRGAFLCTCLSSVIQLFAIEQIIFYIAVQQGYGIWPSILDTMSMYFGMMSIGDMASDMGMSILFMCLGLWISWGSIRRNAYTDVGAVTSVRATLADKASSLF